MTVYVFAENSFSEQEKYYFISKNLAADTNSCFSGRQGCAYVVWCPQVKLWFKKLFLKSDQPNYVYIVMYLIFHLGNSFEMSCYINIDL